MRALVAATLLAGASAPAAAEEWYHIANDHWASIVYADADSVRPAGEAVAVAGFLGSARPFDDAGTLWYSIVQFEFRCSSGEFRFTHADYYDEGRRLAKSSDEIGEWAPVQAKDFTDLLQKFACDGERIDAIPDPFEDAHAFFNSETF